MKKNRFKYIFLFSGILLFTWYISTYWYQLVLVRGDSMIPAYHDRQFVLIDKHTGNYTYDDVVAFQCDGLETVLIKRIVACPGDEVIIDDGRLYVNGEYSVVYSYDRLFDYAGIAETPVHLDTDQYFVIGDNIEKSRDSRYSEVGCINMVDIIGKVF